MIERRPWGHWEMLDEGDGYWVKMITVNPGCRLSLQRHEHRSERWTLLSGRALVTLGDLKLRRWEGYSQTIEIRAGVLHRLANDGAAPLHVLEIALGDILSEDDIERWEDDYARAEK